MCLASSASAPFATEVTNRTIATQTILMPFILIAIISGTVYHTLRDDWWRSIAINCCKTSLSCCGALFPRNLCSRFWATRMARRRIFATSLIYGRPGSPPKHCKHSSEVSVVLWPLLLCGRKSLMDKLYSLSPPHVVSFYLQEDITP